MKSKLDEPISRTVFWFALPFLLLFVGTLFYLVAAYGRANASGYALLALICVPFLCFGLVLYDTKKFWWARRIVALAVFLLYASYAWNEIHAAPRLFSFALLNAVAGFLLVGLPALIYFFFGVIPVDAVFALWIRMLSPLNGVHLWGRRSGATPQIEVLLLETKQPEKAKWYSKP